MTSLQTSPITSSASLCRRLVFGLLGLALCPLALAERVQIESAVVDSSNGQTSAVSHSDGNITTFFTLQKKVVYDTLQGMGLPVDSLPPEVRARLAQFQTQNFEAFRAFANGLNAQDEGRFAQAKAFFQRAIELDPSFTLAKDMEVAMPAADTRNGLQLQAVLREAVKNATQSGKDSVALDVAHAVAAIQSGMTVVAGPAPASSSDTQSSQNSAQSYTVNQAGSGDQYGVRSVVGISYSINAGAGVSVGVAATTDWGASQVRINGNELVSVGNQASFVAQKGSATTDSTQTGSATLSDGSVVNWGGWNSSAGSSALVTVNGVLKQSPELGNSLSYMWATPTPAMPTSGQATFVPNGGANFTGVSGSISTDFAARQVSLNNLAFTLGGYGFSGLNGQASYASTGSGFFSGAYSSGSCSGCSAFSPSASAFTGNFVGSAASGLIFSSILQTGNGTVSGVHLFSR